MSKYQNLSPETLFDNPTRARVYDFIERNPGKHLKEIMSETKYATGSISHALDALRKFDYIVYVDILLNTGRRAARKLFYTTDYYRHHRKEIMDEISVEYPSAKGIHVSA